MLFKRLMSISDSTTCKERQVIIDNVDWLFLNSFNINAMVEILDRTRPSDPFVCPWTGELFAYISLSSKLNEDTDAGTYSYYSVFFSYRPSGFIDGSRLEAYCKPTACHRRTLRSFGGCKISWYV